MWGVVRKSWILAAAMAALPFVRIALPEDTGIALFYSGLILLTFIVVWAVIWHFNKDMRGESNRYKAHTGIFRVISPVTLLFLFICAMSIILSSSSTRFMSWQRLGAFMLLLTVAGPLLETDGMRKIRRKALTMAGWLCVLWSVYYTLLYLFMMTHYCGPLSQWQWMTAHSVRISMLTGALAAFGALIAEWRLLALPRPSRRKWLVYTVNILSFLVCANVMIVASSRIAIVGFIAGSAAMFLVKWHNPGRIRKVHIAVMTAIGVFCCVSMILPMTPIMQVKIHHVEKNGNDYLASRRVMWEERTREIMTHPLTGTGFANVASESTGSYGMMPEKRQSGHIEPGSGWLYVFSATGLPGFLCFIFLIGMTLLHVCRRDALLTGLLCFFCVHIMAEGYVLSAGSTMSYMLWLTIGAGMPEFRWHLGLREYGKRIKIIGES